MDANEQRARHIEMLLEIRGLGMPPCVTAYDEEEIAALDAAIAVLARPPTDPVANREESVAAGQPQAADDAMVERAANAYDRAAVSEGFVSCTNTGSDAHTRWMRAALTAALAAHGKGNTELSRTA